MQVIALSWLVYRLTHSAFLLGVVGFAGQIPIFFFAPFAGVLADRWDRRRVLIATQVLFMSQALTLAALTISGFVKPWHIVGLSLFIGLVNSLDMPVRQAFVVDLVEDREILGNAIALNSMIFNLARLLGPSIAGILIAAAGEGVCFLLNGVSFLAVIFALLAVNVRPRPAPVKNERVLDGLKEGLDYAFGFAPIRRVLSLITLVSIAGMSYVVLMPVFAKELLMGGPHTLGFLMAAAGLGAMAGTIYLASRKGAAGLDRTMPLATIVFGTSLIAVSFSRELWLSLALMLVAGFGLISQMVSANTLLQDLTDDDKRGRVMSLYTISFLGMAPFGSLIAGILASKAGAPNALAISGTVCIIGSFLFLLTNRALR
jgi:MFS family permease